MELSGDTPLPKPTATSLQRGAPPAPVSLFRWKIPGPVVEMRETLGYFEK